MRKHAETAATRSSRQRADITMHFMISNALSTIRLVKGPIDALMFIFDY